MNVYVCMPRSPTRIEVYELWLNWWKSECILWEWNTGVLKLHLMYSSFCQAMWKSMLPLATAVLCVKPHIREILNKQLYKDGGCVQVLLRKTTITASYWSSSSLEMLIRNPLNQQSPSCHDFFLQSVHGQNPFIKVFFWLHWRLLFQFIQYTIQVIHISSHHRCIWINLCLLPANSRNFSIPFEMKLWLLITSVPLLTFLSISLAVMSTSSDSHMKL